MAELPTAGKFEIDLAYKQGAHSASLFFDDPQVGQELIDDAEMLNLRVAETGSTADFLRLGMVPRGDLMFVVCPHLDTENCERLEEVDRHIRLGSRHLILDIPWAALDLVYRCVHQCNPQILVATGRAARLQAINRARKQLATLAFNDLGREERETLDRLSEQVDLIAQRLETLTALQASQSAFRFASPAPEWHGPSADEGERCLHRSPRPPLPDPRLVRRIIAQRRARDRFFGSELFADPAWDMLLDLTAARAEHQRVSVTSLCIASSVPPTTALRWINQMIEAGLFERVEDDSDRRRAFIELSDRTAEAMARYFAELGKEARALV